MDPLELLRQGVGCRIKLIIYIASCPQGALAQELWVVRSCYIFSTLLTTTEVSFLSCPQMFSTLVSVEVTPIVVKYCRGADCLLDPLELPRQGVGYRTKLIVYIAYCQGSRVIRWHTLAM